MAATRRAEFAESLLAEWLADHPRPSESEFGALKDSHPAVADELARLWRGLRRYEQIREGLLAPQPRPARTRPRWRTPSEVAAAMLLLAAIGSMGFVRWRERAIERTSRLAVVARVIHEKARHYVEGLEVDDDAKSELETAFTSGSGSKSGASEDELSEIEERLAECAVLLRGAESLSRKVLEKKYVRESDRETSRNVALDCAELASVRPQESAGWNALALALRRSDNPTFVGSPVAIALRSDPKFLEALEDRAIRSDVPPELLTAIAAACGQVPIEVRAIDLEAGGIELQDATVWVQPLTLPGNHLGKASNVGTTRWKGLIGPGDWRITVIDAAKRRHSELRVLALPYRPLGIQVAFLRSTEFVVAEMAYKPASSFMYGVRDTPAPNLKREYPTSPEQCQLPEFWVDPFEASKEEWAAFHLELSENRDRWFDGELPVPRPSFVDERGICRSGLERKPVVEMTFDHAVVFANWRGKRLPTDREWERIARGSESRKYPWGNEYLAGAIDTSNSWESQFLSSKGPITLLAKSTDELPTSDVDDGTFDEGATPATDGDRVYRLGDNVSEFCEDLSIVRRIDGSYEYYFVGSLLRHFRGAASFQTGSTGSLNETRGSVVTHFQPRFTTIGVRCVKGMLPLFADR